MNKVPGQSMGPYNNPIFRRAFPWYAARGYPRPSNAAVPHTATDVGVTFPAAAPATTPTTPTTPATPTTPMASDIGISSYATPAAPIPQRQHQLHVPVISDLLANALRR